MTGEKSETDFAILKVFFLITDIGFILYWMITFLHIIPDEYLFKDYNSPLLVSWNWSFLPLDLCISFTGILALLLHLKGNRQWRLIAIISLVLTSCSGLQAISFWLVRLDFDLIWWLPNLYLLLYPLFFLPRLAARSSDPA